MNLPAERPPGIPGSALSGPWPVGRYAAGLREKLRSLARVQVFGELVNLRLARARVYFELRDPDGALPCSMWRRDWEAMGAAVPADGDVVVAAGGCDFYPGSLAASPSFSFSVSELRPAGEGDLLAQLERRRRRLLAEGLGECQRRLVRPRLPRTIGVVCAEHGKAGDDVVAGLARRGWAGRLVWAHAPVQDRHAAPLITRALQDLAACPEVEVIVVARGGGSLADLFAFCDETLCRTVALLRVPVIASVGHHGDRTLIDDVAAVSCSTPTHAAEAAVPLDCGAARRDLAQACERIERQATRAAAGRARALAAAARAPAEHVRRERRGLGNVLARVDAAAGRGVAAEQREIVALAGRLARRAGAGEGAARREAFDVRRRTAGLERASAAALTRRAGALAAARTALAGHDPQRTLERGYALLEDPAGAPVTSAAAARRLGAMTVRLHDGTLPVRPEATP